MDKKLLGELEAELDMSEISNYQYVKSKQNMAKYYLGELTEQEVYASNEHLLRMTVPADIKEGVMYYYSQTELEMITQMAIMLRKRGEFEEGTQLLESTLRRMRRSEVDIGFQWNGASFALRVLSALYFSQGRYEEALALDRYILSGDLRRMQGETVAQLLDAVADDLEHMGERYSDKYRKLYRQVYYIADFFKLEKIVAFSRTYYEELFGIEMD